MPKYIAFLRGINVGGHRVKMDRLREIFEEMGLCGVSTFIASGNVIFSSPSSSDVDDVTEKVERHLERRLGYPVATFLRSPAEIEEIATFEATGGGGQGSSPSLYVIFLREPAPQDLRQTLAGLGSEIDEFRFSHREIYWTIQGKISESPLFGTGIERATRGLSTTTRNMTTLRRLVAKLAEHGDVPREGVKRG